MARKLYRVTVQYTLCVLAGDEREAERIGEYHAGDDGSEPDLSVATEIRNIIQIPDQWDHSLPFHNGTLPDERTCLEIVRASFEPAPTQQAPAGNEGGIAQ